MRIYKGYSMKTVNIWVGANVFLLHQDRQFSDFRPDCLPFQIGRNIHIETITLSFCFIKLRALMLKDFICTKVYKQERVWWLQLSLFYCLFGLAWFCQLTHRKKLLNGHIYIYINEVNCSTCWISNLDHIFNPGFENNVIRTWKLDIVHFNIL